MSVRGRLAKPLDDALRPLPVQLVSGSSPDPAIRSFLSNTAKAMLELADLRDERQTTCKTGPGTRRRGLTLSGSYMAPPSPEPQNCLSFAAAEAAAVSLTLYRRCE